MLLLALLGATSSCSRAPGPVQAAAQSLSPHGKSVVPAQPGGSLEHAAKAACMGCHTQRTASRPTLRVLARRSSGIRGLGHRWPLRHLRQSGEARGAPPADQSDCGCPTLLKSSTMPRPVALCPLTCPCHARYLPHSVTPPLLHSPALPSTDFGQRSQTAAALALRLGPAPLPSINGVHAAASMTKHTKSLRRSCTELPRNRPCASKGEGAKGTPHCRGGRQLIPPRARARQ